MPAAEDLSQPSEASYAPLNRPYRREMRDGRVSTSAARLSDSGSRMGAADCSQVRSDAVTVPQPKPLTCPNTTRQVLWPAVRVVRDEEAAGSNPATPTR